MMEDNQLPETVERYLLGQMDPEELARFEALRRSNPEVDQFVVEHSLFISHLNAFGDRKQFKNTLHEIHTNLLDNGSIKTMAPKARVVDMFRKYRRVWAVAASIAGIIAITVSGLVAYFTPNTKPQLEQLSREVSNLKAQTRILTNEVRDSSKI
ncbi:MAG TPA: hypothetical protein VL307_03920, partial [Chitinophagaceae bacterium]|nr:hypothetical protein [Chitinophagaceae bacterium]